MWRDRRSHGQHGSLTALSNATAAEVEQSQLPGRLTLPVTYSGVRNTSGAVQGSMDAELVTPWAAQRTMDTWQERGQGAGVGGGWGWGEQRMGDGGPVAYERGCMEHARQWGIAKPVNECRILGTSLRAGMQTAGARLCCAVMLK